jgi:hypothetical protein
MIMKVSCLADFYFVLLFKSKAKGGDGKPPATPVVVREAQVSSIVMLPDVDELVRKPSMPLRHAAEVHNR